MSTINDLIDIVMSEYDLCREGLAELRAIADEICAKGSVYGRELLEALYKRALEDNLCPECYTELQQVVWREDRGEHFGTPVSEVMTKYQCPNCKWEMEE